MGVEGYVGYWGSGKTLMLCQRVLRELQDDPELLVANNFGLYHPNAFHVQTMDEVIGFACQEFDGRRKLIALDEIGMLLRARGFASWPPAGDVVFQQGRKLRLSLIWTTQHWRFLDVNVRRVTERVTECHGFLPKRLSPWGVKPVQRRPRLIRQRVFMAPNPDSTELPKAPDFTRWSLFNQEVADSYDTMRLVTAAQELLLAQQEEASRSPLVLAVYQHLLDSAAQGAEP